MFRTVLIFMLFCSVALASNSSRRIINGRQGDIKDFPYLASIYYGRTWCGASIISARAVLTAAHCVHDLLLNKTFVRVGTEYRKRVHKKGQLIPVSNILVHPKFNANHTIYYDIAVVWTKARIIMGPNVNKIPLPGPNVSVPVGEVGLVAGWGISHGQLFLPGRFHFALVPILDRKICIKKGSHVYNANVLTDYMICAGYLAGGTDACGGDSGGPLVVNNTLIGVVSFGSMCALKNYPGIYTNVAVFRNWINKSLIAERIRLMN